MTKEVIENNKLIAKFMGWKIWEHNNGLDLCVIPEFFVPEDIMHNIYDVISPEEMRFKSSWDWIFPVLKKIKSCGCIVEISFCFNIECRICIIGDKQEKAINIYSELNGIEGVYDCIIQFIKYYNEKLVK